jgi:hypothetical protein
MWGRVFGQEALDIVRNHCAQEFFLIFYAEIPVYLQFCGKDSLTDSVIQGDRWESDDFKINGTQ